MKYERLTDSETAIMLKNTEGLSWDEDDIEAQRYIRLAELEDKIENGTLVELPCKIGDKVYIIAKQGMDIYVVEETIIVDFWFNKIDNRLYPISASGITLNEIFLTKAEAEKQLEKLRGER